MTAEPVPRPSIPQREPRTTRSGRVGTDGKLFAAGGARFELRGVTYGTFAPRADGALLPEPEDLRRDFAAIAGAGFTVARIYEPPPRDVLEAAEEFGLRLLVGAPDPGWRHVRGASPEVFRRLARNAGDRIKEVVDRLGGSEQVFGLVVSNEIPADVVRWFGAERIARSVSDLIDVAKDADPDLLVTYGNYPTTEYLPLHNVDFVMFNVFLEHPGAFRSYLTRLQHLAGDRPLVMGEIGMNAGGDTEAGAKLQAECLDWQLATSIERGAGGMCVFSWTDDWWVGGSPVAGWNFGLTRADRSPRPALDVATRWNRRTVRDLEFDWPAVSVVVCAHNAAATLDECLRHLCALDYPSLEVIVIDDGSTDDTAAIARSHPLARVVSLPHGGLSVARNVGAELASGDVVAYLDSDAFPTAEWPYFLALGFDSPAVAGVGGPNLPPPTASLAAHAVASSPGGPIHVMLSDEKAEHIPGCNMAFWRDVIFEVGGFDPIYTVAGDDVDFCWRVLDRGWDIRFHPGAMVWHHRRNGIGAYLRQQRGYGRSEALLEARHPSRFTWAGTARWSGRIYNGRPASTLRQSIYRGSYGTAPYQSVYGSGGRLVDLLHQLGVPFAALLLATLPLTALWIRAALPGLLAAAFLLLLGIHDAGSARAAHDHRSKRTKYRIWVAAMHLLQPLARTGARLSQRRIARGDLPAPEGLPVPIVRQKGGVLELPRDRPRALLVAAVAAWLRQAGLRVTEPTGWEPYDARLAASSLVYGDLVTSSHPEHVIQLRVRRRLRRRALLAFAALALLASLVSGHLALITLGAAVAEGARGWWRSGPLVRRALINASAVGGGGE